MTVRNLPSALTIPDVESAACDAHNIAAMAKIALSAESFPYGSSTASVLYVICDLAEILAWNLERLHGERLRSGKL